MIRSFLDAAGDESVATPRQRVAMGVLLLVLLLAACVDWGTL